MNAKKILTVCVLGLAIFAVACSSDKEKSIATIDSVGVGSYDDIFLSTVAGKDVVLVGSIDNVPSVVIPLVEFGIDGSTMIIDGASVPFVSAHSEEGGTYSSDLGTALFEMSDGEIVTLLITSNGEELDMLNSIQDEMQGTLGDIVTITFALQ